MLLKAEGNDQGGKGQTGVKIDKVDDPVEQAPLKLKIADKTFIIAGKEIPEKTDYYKRNDHVSGKDHGGGGKPILVHSVLLPRARYTRPA
jgi:hypothetical protein